ncbi:MAG TPA: GDSL-type esterase/lipase family protein [Thermoleophilaceae bacterium]|nr:GDSL-type esterase/lipase family protein [Thermoleophilaceae bacterium]
MVRCALALVALAALALAAPAAGGDAARAAGHGLSLRAESVETGYVQLRLHASAGVPVRIVEATPGGQAVPVRELTPAAADTTLERAVAWRCDRRGRSFVATDSQGRSAAAQVRTPSCARRLRIASPRRTRAGNRVAFRVLDRWRLGDLRARVCVEPPGGPPRCERRAVGPLGASSSFRALRPGGWLLRASIPGGSARRSVRASGRLSLLATGDSMIQIVDSYLKQRLRPRGVRVRSDAHISTGISKPSLLDWQAHARRQARSRPDVVVMFLGANDGFPMAGAPCCGAAWIQEYARRARRMMAAYGRGGRTRVYWLLLPTPRGGFFRRSFPAVNAGIRRAAARARRDVRVIDLGRVFTPGGRYRSAMRIGGRLVGVRQADGVHLSSAGASLAASIVVRTLRRERILR